MKTPPAPMPVAITVPATVLIIQRIGTAPTRVVLRSAWTILAAQIRVVQINVVNCYEYGPQPRAIFLLAMR